MKNNFVDHIFSQKYKIALAIIAILAFLNLLISNYMLNNQKSYDRLINISGRQRMLSQKIALQIKRIIYEKDQSEIKLIEKKLKADIDLFLNSHNLIIHGEWGAQKRPLSQKAFQHYYKPGGLNELVQSYITRVNKILKIQDSTLLSSQVSDKILKELDKAVHIFENESKKKIKNSIMTQFILFVMTCLVLILESFYIFTPLRKKLRSFITLLKQEKDEAIQAKEIKSRFVTNITHELRTPLNGIIGALELMNINQLNQDNLKYYEIIDSCAKTNLILVNDILDFEKIQENKFNFAPNWSNIEKVMDELKSQFHPISQRKKIPLIVETELKSNYIYTDVTRLKQICSNILSNAFKFTDEGEINLKLKQEEDQFTIIIADTGKGIAKSQQEEIFYAFTQLYQDAKEQVSGTGLGLSIAKSLTELLGGQISLYSKPGEGSKFYLHFQFEHKLIHEDSVAQKSQGTLSTLNEQKKSYKILLLEDNKTNQIIFEKYIQRLGYEITIVNDGEEGLAILKDHSFDLIFSDIQMPNMNGIDFLHEFKRQYPHLKTPIIAFTANALKADREQYLKEGFDFILAKPLKLNELKEFFKEFGQAKE